MRQICLLALVVGLAACASSGNAGAGGPIVDMRGVDAQQYRLDLVECNGYADQVQVGQQAARRAAAGAVVAGAVGAIFDGGDGAVRGAGTGAVVGGAHGASHGIDERRKVVRNCLRNRGYAILN